MARPGVWTQARLAALREAVAAGHTNVEIHAIVSAIDTHVTPPTIKGLSPKLSELGISRWQTKRASGGETAIWTSARQEAFPKLWANPALGGLAIIEELKRIDPAAPLPTRNLIYAHALALGLPRRERNGAHRAAVKKAAPAPVVVAPPPPPKPEPVDAAAVLEAARLKARRMLERKRRWDDDDVAIIARESGLGRFYPGHDRNLRAQREVRVLMGLVRMERYQGVASLRNQRAPA